MFGEENQQLIAELSNPHRISKSVLFDKFGFTPSVSDTSASKIASYDVDPKKYPNAEVEINDNEFSDDSDDEDRKDYEEGGDMGSANNSNTSPSHNDDDESFKYKIEESKRENDRDEEASMLSGSTANSAHTPATTASSKRSQDQTDSGQSQSVMSGTHEQLDTVTELSSWEANSNIEDKSAVSSLNPGGEKARAMNDDTIFDAKEAMESCGAPNSRQVHSLDLRSVYESYGVAGEPLYTTSSPEESNFRITSFLPPVP